MRCKKGTLADPLERKNTVCQTLSAVWLPSPSISEKNSCSVLWLLTFNMQSRVGCLILVLGRSGEKWSGAAWSVAVGLAAAVVLCSVYHTLGLQSSSGVWTPILPVLQSRRSMILRVVQTIHGASSLRSLFLHSCCLHTSSEVAVETVRSRAHRMTLRADSPFGTGAASWPSSPRSWPSRSASLWTRAMCTLRPPPSWNHSPHSPHSLTQAPFTWEKAYSNVHVRHFLQNYDVGDPLAPPRRSRHGRDVCLHLQCPLQRPPDPQARHHTHAQHP